MSKERKVTIIGAGPAGLFSAYILLEKGFQVDLYDHSGGAAKKFLIAGNGGLNLTHSEELDVFCSRYGDKHEIFKSLIKEFSPTDLRDWCHKLGIETFVGTSGRVFPKNLKAGLLLTKWMDHLKGHDSFKLFLKHSLIGLTKNKELTFSCEEGEKKILGENIIFALGGASWKKTGSTGSWKELLEATNIQVKEFKPMNCGFERGWSPFFKEKFDYTPLKNIAIEFLGETRRGEIMLTPYGAEGGVIYAFSREIRQEIEQHGKAVLTLDLKPSMSLIELSKKLESRKKKVSLSKFFKANLKLAPVVYPLMKEVLSDAELTSSDDLAKGLKGLKLSFNSLRPLDEAISTSGGVCFSELDETLELRKIPGLYIVGEMLDFDAPTGGYLLQGCFSSAFRASRSIYLKES